MTSSKKLLAVHRSAHIIVHIRWRYDPFLWGCEIFVIIRVEQIELLSKFPAPREVRFMNIAINEQLVVSETQ